MNPNVSITDPYLKTTVPSNPESGVHVRVTSVFSSGLECVAALCVTTIWNSFRINL